jgi:hypothetical protein
MWLLLVSFLCQQLGLSTPRVTLFLLLLRLPPVLPLAMVEHRLPQVGLGAGKLL